VSAAAWSHRYRTIRSGCIRAGRVAGLLRVIANVAPASALNLETNLFAWLLAHIKSLRQFNFQLKQKILSCSPSVPIEFELLVLGIAS
jgi:hypothetical protein